MNHDPAPPAQPAEIVLDFHQRERPSTASPAGEPELPLQHAIRFSGSGSEYFRIWIVNLLLMIVTLTLYYPWAKVRKLRYFHTNTAVDNHAMDFHGRPAQILRGYLLVLALAGAYALAAATSPQLEGLALLLLALIWPALWRASLQFRLANTSWRGLRFAFTGSLGGAYGALLLPWLAILGFGLAGGLLIGLVAAVGNSQAATLLPLLMALGVYALLPYLWLRLKCYQHGHYAYAQLQTRLTVPTRAVYRMFVRLAGVVVLAGLGFLAGALLLAVLSGGTMGSIVVAMAAFAPVLALLALLAQVFPRAYATARLQNLLWSGTHAAPPNSGPDATALRFDSTLAFGPLARLMLKNWLLILVTLGLYWPWAAVATARMRLEAVRVRSAEPLDTLVATGRARHGDAAGDAAGDMFGVDLGL